MASTGAAKAQSSSLGAVPCVTLLHFDIDHVCPCSAFSVWNAGRRDFPAFPHTPYEIQKTFMESMYSTLEKGGVGLFESPTGNTPEVAKPSQTPPPQPMTALQVLVRP